MLQLSTTSHILRLVSASAGDIRTDYSYVDLPTTVSSASSAGLLGVINAAITTATTTTIVAAPASSTARNVKQCNVFNVSASVSNLINIERFDGTNAAAEWKGTLLPGESVKLNENGDWIYYDASGQQKFSPGAGQFIASTFLTASSGTFTTGPNTRTIRIRGVGGGGAGGGCTSVAAAASAGGGGGAGGYAEKNFTVTPSTGYSYTCGAAGAGASGAAGGNGGTSTFIVGATTVTCGAGQGGVVATAVTTPIAYRGGTQSAVSTNGDINGAGGPGDAGIILNITGPVGLSGVGASGEFGAGGTAVIAVGNGTAALGFGAGGSGGLTGASAARTGGNGTAGCWAVDEYT